MPVYWVDTIASPAKSIVSQIRPRNRLYDATSHEAWTSGYARDVHWIYFFLTRIRENCHVGNVDILGLDIESSGLNSVILRFSDIQAPISVFWSLNIFTDTQQRIVWLYDRWDVLNTQVCATRAVCILVPEWSLQYIAMILHDTRDRFLFPRILLVQNHKTICPTWATHSLLLSCV